MKIIHFLFFIFLSTIVSATDYYFSLSGNDNTNNGLSSTSPWQTMTKLNSIFSTLKPGDRILFNRGETFYGTLKISSSGIAGNPIIIGAYGTGNAPIITGLTTISSWFNQGNGIYSKNVSGESAPNIVTVDEINTPMGRWPNSGWRYYENHADSNVIIDNELTAIPDWDGAELVLCPNAWSIERRTITNHTNSSIKFNPGSNLTINDNYGYFIQQDLKCLDDILGEWYYETLTSTLFMYFGTYNPNDHVVNIATIDRLVSITGHDYITFENISFKGSNICSIDLNRATHVTIQNCNIDFSGGDAIKATSTATYLSVNNTSINHTNNNAIISDGSCAYGLIINNVIQNTGIIPGLVTGTLNCLGIGFFGDNSKIQNNQVINTGYIGIIFNGNNITIQNNLVDYFGLTKDDGGGIYTSGNLYTGRSILGNVVLNGGKEGILGVPYSLYRAMHGIYLDDNCTNVTVTGNTTANCSYSGIYLHNAHNNKLEDNTAFNNIFGQICFYHNDGADKIHSNIIKNNIFFAKAANHDIVFFRSSEDDITAFGTADNNYYARPVDDYDVFNISQPSMGTQNITLAEWQSITGQDANSLKSPITIRDTADIDFYFNPTKTDIIITLIKPMIDVRNTKYVNNITLKPFTSAILMVDPNPSPTIIPLYSGSIIQNATPSILEMTYNVSLANVIPTASAYSVRVNSISRTVDKVAISGTKVLLTLGTPIVYGDVVTVSYTKPSSNPLQTASGGQAANISDQPVTNNTINVVPTVAIISPINNSSFAASANITITANASDADGSITMVEFYNSNIKLGSKTAAPFSFTWNNVPAGTYSLTVIATDNQNAKVASTAILISVIDGTPVLNQPPVVIITNPSKGDEYENPATITIDAIASDPDGTVSKLELYNGSEKIVEIASAPYSFTWKDLKAGTYIITAIATDNLNATTTSSSIEFTVRDVPIYDANSEILNLYPNPNDGHFSIEILSPLQNEKSDIIITDLSGKQVYHGSLLKEETVKQFDLSYFKSGIYIMMIADEVLLVTKKIIKK